MITYRQILLSKTLRSAPPQFNYLLVLTSEKNTYYLPAVYNPGRLCLLRGTDWLLNIIEVIIVLERLSYLFFQWFISAKFLCISEYVTLFRTPVSYFDSIYHASS
jgi:hypothetical protein